MYQYTIACSLLEKITQTLVENTSVAQTIDSGLETPITPT